MTPRTRPPPMKLEAETLPTPRGAHLEMVGAVLAGDGLERVAEIAAGHAGAPVAVIVPRLGAPVEAWARLRALRGEAAGGRQARAPGDVIAEVPIVSGGQELGAVLMLGKGRADAGEYLHVAAVAALTEVAVAEARDETEQTLRGSFLEELLTRDDLEPADVVRRAARLGCDLSGGAVGLCADPGERAPGRLLAAISGELAGVAGPGRGRARVRAAARRRGGRAPGRDPARPPARPSASPPTTRTRPTCAARSRRPSSCWASRPRAAAPPGEEIGGGTYRLLFRVLASHPEEVRSFYEDTIAPLVALRRAVHHRPGRHARGLPRPQLQHERHGAGDPRPPPHGGLPPRAGEGADRASTRSRARTASGWAWASRPTASSSRACRGDLTPGRNQRPNFGQRENGFAASPGDLSSRPRRIGDPRPDAKDPPAEPHRRPVEPQRRLRLGAVDLTEPANYPFGANVFSPRRPARAAAQATSSSASSARSTRARRSTPRWPTPWPRR